MNEGLFATQRDPDTCAAALPDSLPLFEQACYPALAQRFVLFARALREMIPQNLYNYRLPARLAVPPFSIFLYSWDGKANPSLSKVKAGCCQVHVASCASA